MVAAMRGMAEDMCEDGSGPEQRSVRLVDVDGEEMNESAGIALRAQGCYSGFETGRILVDRSLKVVDDGVWLYEIECQSNWCRQKRKDRPLSKRDLISS